jgi:hypothetical protein
MKKHLRVPLAFVATASGVACLLYIQTNQRGERSWTNTLQELRAKGETIAWEDIIPPPVPGEQNLFNSPGIEAWFSQRAWQSNHVPVFALDVKHPPLTLTRLRALPICSTGAENSTVWDSSLEQLGKGFAQIEGQRQLLAEACKRPLVRFETEYSDPTSMEFPNFVNLRRVAQTLAGHHSLSLLNNQPEQAIQDLFMMRRLADLAGSVPLAVGAMVQQGIMDLYVSSANDALDSGLLTDAELRAIQEQIREEGRLGLAVVTGAFSTGIARDRRSDATTCGHKPPSTLRSALLARLCIAS